MSELNPPGEGDQPKKKSAPTKGRIASWVLVGGAGLYLVISGLIQMLSSRR